MAHCCITALFLRLTPLKWSWQQQPTNLDVPNTQEGTRNNWKVLNLNFIHGNGTYHRTLTLILLTWRIWWAHTNDNKWQMGFNLAFKGLKTLSILSPRKHDVWRDPLYSILQLLRSPPLPAHSPTFPYHSLGILFTDTLTVKTTWWTLLQTSALEWLLRAEEDWRLIQL